MSGLSETPGSLAGLVGTLATDVQELVRGEIRLARAELDRNLASVITSAISLVGGALVAFAGLVTLLQGGAVFLGHYMPLWVAFVVVGFVILIVGAALARVGLSGISLKTMIPDRTGANLRKDAAVIKEHA